MIDVRDRLTERVTTARVRLELRRGRGPALVVALGALLGAGCLGYVVKNVSRTLLARTYEVEFAVDDATAVVAGRNEVRFRGIPAGTITAVRRAGHGAVLTVSIQRDFGPLYRDARAALRPNTALQDMYLDILERGHPEAGRAGAAPIAATQTATAVNPAEVLDVFEAGVRARLRTFLDNFGRGLDGRGAALRTAFAEVVPFLRVAGRMSEQLARRERLTRRLVRHMTLLTSELARRERTVRELVRSGGETLAELQRSAGSIGSTLAELPPALDTLDGGFVATRAVLDDVDEAVMALRPLAARLPASLAALRRLAGSADPALRALQRPLARLVPLAETLPPLSSHLAGAFAELRPQAPTIDRVTRNIAACERPIQGFFHWDASLLKFSDPRGGVARGNAEYNLSTSGVAADPHARFHPVCVPGPVLGGRPPRPEDEH